MDHNVWPDLGRKLVSSGGCDLLFGRFRMTHGLPQVAQSQDSETSTILEHAHLRATA